MATRRAPIIAAEFHRRGIPQVLGYFGPVPDPLAVEVDRALFEAIRVSGRTLHAVREARRRTQAPIATPEGPRCFPLAWSLLGLYHRGPDAPIADVTRPLDARQYQALERRPVALHGLQVLTHGFIGRRRLLASLRSDASRSRVVGLFGLGGLGKTATMIRLVRILHGSEESRIQKEVVVLPLAAGQEDRPDRHSAMEWLRARVHAAVEAHPRRPAEWDRLMAAIDKRTTATERGAALAERLLDVARHGTIYIDNAETLQVDLEAAPADGRIGWISDETAAFFTALAAGAASHDVTLLVTTRYRPEGMQGLWTEVPPCSEAEIFRMTGWFGALQRLPASIRATLARERLSGHPRSVEWLDGLLSLEEERLGRRIDSFSSDDEVLATIVEPALAGVPTKAEADLLLTALIKRLGDEPRRLLGECTAIGLPVPREVIAQLGRGDQTLIDRGLLTQFADLGYAVHPLVTQTISRRSGGPVWTVAGRATLGRWWLDRAQRGAPYIVWIEAVRHLIDGACWDEALPAVRAISDGTRQRGWIRPRLQAIEQCAVAAWPDDKRATILMLLADARLDAGNFSEAESAARDSVAVSEKAYGTRDHASVAASLHGLANVLVRQGRFKEAEQAYRDSIAIKEKAYGTRDHAEVAASLHGLANVLVSQGRF
ncbi:MAG TPA: tetratricopeptide repeat protein, partial [Phycisphaerales bacterium]|nr:tetratricopeptide repeat protein [Phycisphaerales bacterium]